MALPLKPPIAFRFETPNGQPGKMHTTVDAFRDERCPPFIEVVLAGVESFVSEPDRRGVRRDAQERLVSAS